MFVLSTQFLKYTFKLSKNWPADAAIRTFH